jgi:hypothetical protein
MEKYYTIVKYNWNGMGGYYHNGDQKIYNSYEEAKKILDLLNDDNEKGIYYRIVTFKIMVNLEDIIPKDTDNEEMIKMLNFINFDYMNQYQQKITNINFNK